MYLTPDRGASGQRTRISARFTPGPALAHFGSSALSGLLAFALLFNFAWSCKWGGGLNVLLIGVNFITVICGQAAAKSIV